MPIKINGSTSGSTTITAPATGTDETIELSTALAAKAALAGATYTGTHNFSGATVVEPAGRILQVVQGTSTTSTSITSSTWTDTTLSASITPSLSTSKILVIVNQSSYGYRAYSNFGHALRILRGATSIYGGVVQYERQQVVGVGAGNSEGRDRMTMVYLDSPATTSAVTYKTQGSTDSGASTLVTQFGSTTSTIILMEVSA